MEELGYALRLARERRGLTQTQVMNLTGINNKTLSGYENNIAEPDLQTLTTCCGSTGCRRTGCSTCPSPLRSSPPTRSGSSPCTVPFQRSSGSS